MGFFKRIFSLGAGKANDAVDALEDANMDTVIRQSIREMESDLEKTIKASAEAMASANQIQTKYDNLKRDKKEWEGKAQQALAADKEDLALKALEKVTEVEQAMADLEPAVKQSKAACESLKKKVDDFKSRIQKAKTESKTLIARHEAAKAQKKLASAAAGVGSTDNAFAKMERFKERVSANEAEANAYDDLGSNPDDELEKEFSELNSSAATDKLAAMKAKLGK